MLRLSMFLLSLLMLHRSNAELVGAAVIPHGDFAFDPSLVNFTNDSAALHEASLRAGQFVANELAPDIIFLSTPHGLALSDDFLIYENPVAAGAAPVGNDLPHHSTYNVQMTLRSDTTLARKLRLALQHRGYKATGLQGFGGSQPLPVSWGEILPLSFVNSSEASGRQMPPVVILSVPYRRYNHSAEMVPEMLQLGAALAEELHQDSRRIAWITSADLAHTHLSSGPYGFCACAKPFDVAIGRWMQELDSEALLVEATKQQKLGAASCGFTGLVLLEGAVDVLDRSSWDSKLLAIAAPTYYGMAIATFRHKHIRTDPQPLMFHI